jgi:hypothetical protein
LVVVILAAMWVLVLVPPLLRSRSEGRPSTSIGSFRHQLATLSRTGHEPRAVVRPINRGVVPMHPPVGMRRPGGPGAGMQAFQGQALQYQGGYDDYPGPGAGYGGPPMAPSRRPVEDRWARSSRAPIGYSARTSRSEVRRRRQNVLFALVATAAVTGLGGFGMGISALIGINLIVDAVLIFYVYLLVQLRRAEEQRAMRYDWSKAA